jgi:signal transduction histidine kinase
VLILSQMPWTQFFATRLPHIYFIYGLSFFALGIAVALEIGRGEPSRFRRAIWPFALFGLVHGVHEWIEMFALVGQQAYGFEPSIGFDIFRLIFLIVSFALLIIFGGQLAGLDTNWPYAGLIITSGMLLLYSMSLILLGQWLGWLSIGWFASADVLARYTLAIPGAVLTAWALLKQRKIMPQSEHHAFALDITWVAAAILLYGVVGQFFVNPSPLFPSNMINAMTFQNWFGIPIQLFRATMAVIAAIFTIRAMRAFEIYRQQALAKARQQVEVEISRRHTLRRELLQRVVETQEDERRRIARELHDELGQVLTGLALGLRGTKNELENPDQLAQQLEQLEGMAVQATDDMRHMVNELRPALLDDIGLSAALRNYVDNFVALTGIETQMFLCTTCDHLDDTIKTTLFRVTQESLTNVARHAQATQTWVNMECDDAQVVMKIKDNGIGFDPDEILASDRHEAWGLIGIEERVKLVDGTVKIVSQPNRGTTVAVTVPKQEDMKV